MSATSHLRPSPEKAFQVKTCMDNSELCSSMITCPMCGYKLSLKHKGYAVISPWIREWGGVRTRTSEFFVCGFCEGGFFDYRYSDEEMANIYSQYRSSEYTTTRTKWEPWYTDIFNLAHNLGPLVEERKVILELFLARCGVKDLKTVVDVGGDLGQGIPDFNFDTSKYVLDVTNRELVHGVHRVKALDELSEIDLIIFANVLEHVANPLADLGKLLLSAKFVYVEVPFGVPTINFIRKLKAFQVVIVGLSLNSHFWKWFSIPSTGRDPRSSILRQSEHIQFFNEVTLKVMAEKLKKNIVLSVATIPTPEGGKGKAIQALFY